MCVHACVTVYTVYVLHTYVCMYICVHTYVCFFVVLVVYFTIRGNFYHSCTLAATWEYIGYQSDHSIHTLSEIKPLLVIKKEFWFKTT